MATATDPNRIKEKMVNQAGLLVKRPQQQRNKRKMAEAKVLQCKTDAEFFHKSLAMHSMKKGCDPKAGTYFQWFSIESCGRLPQAKVEHDRGRTEITKREIERESVCVCGHVFAFMHVSR